MLKANRTFQTLTGHPDDTELVGRPFTGLLTVGSRMFFETHLRTLLHLDGHVNEVALELNRADGSTLPVLVNAVLDRSADGGPGITRVAVFDATERRHYEQELLAAKRRAEASEQRSADLARTLQDTLMPPRHPTITGMDVATAYRPAGEGDEIGGDFYDVFEVADHDWVVALGDVAGKGVAAAVVATLARHTIRAVAVSEASPAEILRQLNQVILHHPTERFCTAVVLRMRRVGATWDALMSTGGHPPAIVLDDDLRTIGSPAHLIGVFEDAEYEDLRFEMPPGTTVLLHTDGITDGRRDRELYGEERLMRLLRRNTDPTDVLVARILEDVLRFQDGNARDDIALVALHVPEGRS